MSDNWKVKEKEAKQIIDDLVSLRDEGKNRNDSLVRHREEQLRQVLNIQEGDWIRACEGLTTDDIIDIFSSEVGNTARTELTPERLLEKASGGLALKGILITRDGDYYEHHANLRNVLDTPEGIVFKDPISGPLKRTVEFSSKCEADNFQSSVDDGVQKTRTKEEECLSIGHQEEIKALDDHRKEKYYCLLEYIYFPTAACELDQSKLRLSNNILGELKELEKLVLYAQDKIALSACEEFLCGYGSHVNIGPMEFGGIYEWVATYSGFSPYSERKVREMTRNVLAGYKSLSNSVSGFDIGCSITGDRLKTQANIPLSYDTSELSKITIHGNIKGGPHRSRSLNNWKSGLQNNNATWAVIDRGGSNITDFLGVWKLVQNHGSEFKDAMKLAEALRRSWDLMNSNSTDSVTGADKVLEVINSTIDIIHKVQEWVTDTDFQDKFLDYLQKLQYQVEDYHSTTGNIKLWVEALENNESLCNFFVNVTQFKGRCSQSELTHMTYFLNKLTKLADVKSKICQWLSDNDNSDEYNSGVKAYGNIRDIPGLLYAIERAPEVQVNYDKLETVGESTDPIDYQVTVNVGSAVHHLRTHLEAKSKRYELFFLLAALQELGYNIAKETFHSFLTQQIVTTFAKNCAKSWGDYLKHEKEGSLKFQAFLVRFLIDSLSQVNDPTHKERKFLEMLKEIKDSLNKDLDYVLQQFTSCSPLNWEDLVVVLEKVLKDDLEDMQNPTLYIKELWTIPDSGPHPEYHDQNISTPGEKTYPGELLKLLGLTEYYPSRISLQNVITIGKTNANEKDLTNIPWLILLKLIMLDYNARDSCLSAATSKDHGQTRDVSSDENCSSILDLVPSGADDMEAMNPLDVFITIYNCCDLLLKQTLAQKMFLCRLAVPLIYPQLTPNSLTYSLWALRSIILKWSDRHSICETSVVNQKMKSVLFIRLGKPSCSKSILLNNVISDQAHDTFWNRECPLGHTEFRLADGLVETTWYLPAGNYADAFQEATMFLNLRGDACKHVKQLQILQEVSNVIVCCIETTHLESPKAIETMKHICDSPSKVVFFLTRQKVDSAGHKTMENKAMLPEHISQMKRANTKVILGYRKSRVKALADSKMELRQAIKEFSSDEPVKSIEDASTLAQEMGIKVDEFEELCQEGKGYAEHVISCLKEKTITETIKAFLPLQGINWQIWCNLLKEKLQPGRKNSLVHDMAVIEQNMTSLRKKQLKNCSHLSELMKIFRRYLLETKDSPVVALYMQWLNICLDEIRRKNILHQSITDSSLGVEHLLRELAQMYEAAIESRYELQEETLSNIRQLPELAAKLLLKGHPMEIMDGDASNIPLTWIQAVLSNLKSLVGDKRLFVISILGIQSSGKSTLLNTMFGLQFSVGAGRSTHGAVMQLIQVDGETKLPYDYVFVIDTEGLHTREDTRLKLCHDNQLATFVIGLGDATIININRENLNEISDVLQIAVHAFLRMKMVNQNFQLHRTCLFIHQNVPEIYAREKNLKETLDRMTSDASIAENIHDINSFNEVIGFDADKGTYHISYLWYGDSPMAPINPRYTEKVQEIKQYLLHDLFQGEQTFLKFSDLILRVQDLWNAVLSDDFVFNFKNSLEAKAYRNLESFYQEKYWSIQKAITDWQIEKVTVELGRCSTITELDSSVSQLKVELNSLVGKMKNSVRSALENYFDNNILSDILSQWRDEKIQALNSDVQSLLTRAQKKLSELKETTQIDLFHRGNQWESDIIKMAKAFSDRMDGKKADENELRSTFNEFWIECQNDIGSRSIKQIVPIEKEVERMLRQYLRTEYFALVKELEEYPLSEYLSTLEGSISVQDIKESHFSRSFSFAKHIQGLIFHNDPQLECRYSVVEVVNITLRKINVYLCELREKGLQFQELYATEVIRFVLKGVDEHNNQETNRGFTLLPSLKVKVAVHVCRYAVGIFQKLQADYEENHGTAKKLQENKNSAWKMFNHLVNQRSVDVLTAELLIDHLEGLVKKMVKSKVTVDIINSTVQYFDHQKYNLIVNIMSDLALKGNFSNYLFFILNAKEFSCDWIISFIQDKYLSTNNGQTSLYVSSAKVHITTLAECIRQAVQATTKETQQITCITTWIETFSTHLKKLPIRKADLEHVMEQNICDFGNLERLLIMRLQALEETVLYTFVDETAQYIGREERTQYREVINRLWGCEAQCPFCNEPCLKTDADHVSTKDSHQCIQHRVSGVAGNKSEDFMTKGKLVTDTCNSKVKSNSKFNCNACSQQCIVSGKCTGANPNETYHEYRQYKTYLPHWDITPECNLETSKYWKWFMVKYEKQLTEYYEAKKPNIPKNWKTISQEQALQSLCMYDGLHHLNI